MKREGEQTGRWRRERSRFFSMVPRTCETMEKIIIYDEIGIMHQSYTIELLLIN